LFFEVRAHYLALAVDYCLQERIFADQTEYPSKFRSWRFWIQSSAKNRSLWSVQRPAWNQNSIDYISCWRSQL